jgi:predicted nucleotidyltransferase
MLNVSPKHLKTVKEILRTYLPECEVWAFGSRLTGQAKSYSDLDLAIIGKNKLPAQTMIKLKEAFEESILPFRVDILDWHKLSGSFKKIIQQKYAVIQNCHQNN